MESDYVIYNETKEKLLDELGIDYTWRDSCVNLLIETKRCFKTDFKTNIPLINKLSVCNSIQEKWKECEKEREIKLLDNYFIKYKEYQENIMKDK